MCTDRETLTDFQDLATMLLRTPRIPYHLAPDHTPENHTQRDTHTHTRTHARTHTHTFAIKQFKVKF